MNKALTPLLLALLATPALAHVSLDPARAETGKSVRLALRVPHGCDGSATTAVTVRLPDGVQLAKPMPKPGWELSTRKDKVTPFDNHGERVSEDVKEIRWAGGKLPDAYYDEFVFRARIAAAPGTLAFKVKQECERGQTDWAEVAAAGQDAHALKAPAPTLEVTAGGEHQH